jgi:hypothetical protein
LDIGAIPIAEDFSPYDLIMLTGGEPMLRPDIVRKVIHEIRLRSSAPIYLYTAKTDNPKDLIALLKLIDGICVTIHAKRDVKDFTIFCNSLMDAGDFSEKSLRLNVFRGISIKDVDTTGWIVKKNISWIKNAPLPEGEELLKLGTQ